MRIQSVAVAFFVLALVCPAANAQPRQRNYEAQCAREKGTPPAPDAPFSAPNFSVYDGDTIRTSRGRIRVSNLDAPEIPPRSDCAFEERLGRQATTEAQALMRNARSVRFIPDGTRDYYCRIRARVEVDGRDLGQNLIRRGLARPWTGRSSNWCQSR